MKSINDKGVTAVEYGLISALISIVIMSSVQMTGVSTTPVSDKASMDALISSTTDKFDTSYTPEAYGGCEKERYGSPVRS